MVREFSAGGVVLRRMSGDWYIAAIEPEKEEPHPVAPAASAPASRSSPFRKA